MKEETIHKRTIVAYANPERKTGRLVITAKLTKLGDQKPYFSITTGAGCAHDQILEARPDLKFMVDLHLSDDTGWPMHAIDNAVYHIKEGNLDTAARHLRLRTDEDLKGLMGQIMVEGRMAYVNAKDAAGRAMVKAAEGLRRAKACLPERGTSVTMDTYFKKAGEAFNPMLESADAIYDLYMGNTDAIDQITTAIEGPLVENRVTKKLERRKQAGLRWYYKHGGRDPWFNGTDMVGQVKKLRGMLESLESLISSAPVEVFCIAAKHKAERKVVDDLVHGQLAKQWEKEAKQAIAWLQESDFDNDLANDAEDNEEECEFDPSTDQLVKFGDDQITEIVGCYEGGYLPLVDLGGEDYYIAADSEAAGEAAREYWKDIAEKDPKEFSCLVGEETLIKWGMGQPAGPGSIQVKSLYEWLDLHLTRPGETFASYDGNEMTLEISAGLADELGIDNDEESDYVSVIAYRHN